MQRLKTRKTAYIFMLSIVGIIIASTIAILFITISEKSQKQTVEEEIQEDNEIQGLILKLSDITTEEEKEYSPEYGSAIDNFNDAIIASSAADKYEQFTIATMRTQAFYTDTNNPKLYDFINEDLNKYARENYPEYFEKERYKYPCQDSTCSKEPQPEEIKSIINDVENGKFSDDTKYMVTVNLKSASYLNDENDKFNLYINSVAILRAAPSEENNQEEINKVAQELDDYLKINYPDMYDFHEKAMTAFQEKLKNNENN